MMATGKSNKPQRMSSSTFSATLRQGIREGKYVAGQRLIENDLMTTDGISQRQVRDSLHGLAVEGLVTIEKNRGATVRKLSRSEVSCILDVLDSLSLLAVRQAAENAHVPGKRKIIKTSLQTSKQFRKAAKTEKRLALQLHTD